MSASAHSANDSGPGAEPYLIGVGIADITGEPSRVGMMGYAMPQQRTAGVHQRQWSRAFVVAQPDARAGSAADSRIVYVVADLGMIFTAVQQEVLRRLKSQLGDRYHASNTVLTATHTHSGPGGFSHHTLYNITSAGFRPRTFEAIVGGIVTSILRADQDVAPGSIALNSGELYGASVNRALPAFERNPARDRRRFPAAVDPEMTVLRFQREGRDVGVLSWFATHGTSMPNTNRLISGDNKGFAAYRWEHDWSGRDSLAKAAGEPGFVAGFAQGNAGDMSPNVGAGTGYGPANNLFANTRTIGDRQALRARELWQTARHELHGPVDYRQRNVDFSQVRLSAEFVGTGEARTWPAVIGQAFMSGCFDGHGVKQVRQGDLRRGALSRTIDKLAMTSLGGMAIAPPEVLAGHSPKPAALATGLCTPPWTPQILPLQIVRIGQLAIVAGPGEFTITSGLRIRETVAAALGPDVTHIVFAGYANAYAGYVTTPEEYNVQLYEGGSTHFGPATLPAFQQEFQKLARGLASGDPTPSVLELPDLAAKAWAAQPPASLGDRTGPRRRFGACLTQPRPRYRAGEIVKATFASANPNRFLHPPGSFLSVERQEPNEWVSVANDDDWHTVVRWRRGAGLGSIAALQWLVPQTARPGRYRMVHSGRAHPREGAIDFTGQTRSFEVS